MFELQIFRSLTVLKREGTSTQIFYCKYWEIYQNTYFEEQLQTTASAFLETVLLEHSSDHNLATGTLDETKMKGSSNQSRLNKSVSHHQLLGEDRKD